jgi:phage shock protein PspC (stress-responsive transcriptional regulator)
LKDYFIRLIFGLLTIGICLGIAHIFNFDKNTSRNLFILPIAIAGGWGGWYIYNAIKKEN